MNVGGATDGTSFDMVRDESIVARNRHDGTALARGRNEHADGLTSERSPAGRAPAGQRSRRAR